MRSIAIFLPSLEAGGAERVTLTLARGLKERGYSVSLILAKAKGPFLAQVPPQVRVVDLKSSRTSMSLLPLMNYLRRERPSALFSALNHVNIVALAAKSLASAGVKTVVTEHVSLLPSAQNAPSYKGRVIPFLIRHFYPQADAVVAVSEGVARELIEVFKIPAHKVKVIYNPVVTPEVFAKAQETLAHPWFQPGQPPVILGVGRLVLEKDFSLLIRAFARLRKSKGARLLILGEGPERPRLENLVRELGLEQDAALPGFVENPYPYMRQAAVLALSSRWEALPTVLIEAMALGTRVVATDCPYGPREILEGGKWGQLVPVGHEEALAQAILKALDSSNNKNESLGEMRKSIEERFGLDRALSAYEKILLGQ